VGARRSTLAVTDDRLRRPGARPPGHDALPTGEAPRSGPVPVPNRAGWSWNGLNGWLHARSTAVPAPFSVR